MREREEDYSLDPVDIYLREAGQVPLLTREEEVELARQHHQGRKAEARLKELEKDGLKPEERSRLKFLISQGSKAKETLVKSNSRLVFSIARKKLGRGVPFMDLIQEGNIGLLKAVEKFDPDRGVRFSTFAFDWIRQTVGRAVAEQGRTIRIPGHASEELKRFRRKTIELTGKFGREPTLEELAKELGWSRQRAERVAGIPIIVLSLDMPIGVEKDSYLGELIEDIKIPQSSEEIEEIFEIDKVAKVVNEVLTEREQRILGLRFVQGLTLGEIGQEFGLSRERIRQIQEEVLEKIRQQFPLEKAEAYSVR